jgi:hypothetical protein
MPGILLFFAEAQRAIATLHRLSVTSAGWLDVQLVEFSGAGQPSVKAKARVQVHPTSK